MMFRLKYNLILWLFMLVIPVVVYGYGINLLGEDTKA
jgi:hypothetical protein